jgi:hypothetical protein
MKRLNTQALRRLPEIVAASAHTAAWHSLLLAAALLLSALPVGRLTAQPIRIDTSEFINHFPLPDAAVPMRSAWGFNDDEFSIGAFFSIWPNDMNNVGELWDIAHNLGVSIYETRQYANDWVGYDRYYDGLLAGATPREPGPNGRWHDRVIAASDRYTNLGFAREVILYPFDSSQSYYWPCFFKTRSGGYVDTNRSVVDHFRFPTKEQVYSLDSTTPGQIVAERMVFGYDTSQQIRRYPKPLYHGDDSCEIAGEAFWERNDLDFTPAFSDTHFKRPARWLYFVVTGHLFDPITDGGGGAVPSDSLLVVEIWNEIPQGTKYRDSSGIEQTATSDLSFLYRRLNVTKASMMPGADSNYNAYKQQTFMVDMITNSDTADTTNTDMTLGMGGAWNVISSASGKDSARHRFEVKLRWTGKEKIALRSIAIRDTAAQLLFGNDAAGIDFRQKMINLTDSLVWGTNFANPALRDTTRGNRLIRLYTGDEPVPLQFAGFNWLDSTLFRRYDSTSLLNGVRAWHGRNQHNTNNLPLADMNNVLQSSDNEINVETYGALSIDTWDVVKFGLPAHIYARPALREHNGGRFQSSGSALTKLPELILDTTSLAHSRDSVALYTNFFQRVSMGVNNPGRAIYPWKVGTKITSLAMAAWTARRTGRRLIQWPGTMGRCIIKWNATTSSIDTVLWSLPEPAEMRAWVNVGLAYSARGVHYPMVGANRMWHGDTVISQFVYDSDWGPHGPLTTDTSDTATLTFANLFHIDTAFVITVPTIYTGWGTNGAQLRWLDTAWLPKIGPEMLKLRWRDGYSINFTVPQQYMIDSSEYKADTVHHPRFMLDQSTSQTRSRPLPSTEIVTKVEAFDIYGHKDSAEVTYVELGLFDTKITRDSLGNHLPLKDTNHIFLVNRRTFERSDDIDPNTTRGRLMDSLAETRLVKLQLNLKHPDSSGYQFCRVRELAADSTPLPHADSTPRHILDTAVYADSAVTVLLGPGRATLLEITYLPPGDSIPNAALPRNGQRKLLYTGTRYYTTYERNSGAFSKIYYRRSELMRDTSVMRGAIEWEPWEYEISNDMGLGPARGDHHDPSMTMRIRKTLEINSHGDTLPHLDSVLSITWTCHSAVTFDPTRREVVLRNILHNGDGLAQLQMIETVDTIDGYQHEQWGTPVVSSLYGGDVIAYSDSIWGIKARMRYLDTSAVNWWVPAGIYSDTVIVADGPFLSGSIVQYPTMPAFTQIKEQDSTVGIAWQEQTFSLSPSHSFHRTSTIRD